MSHPPKGIAWIRDLAQIFFLDRFHPQRKDSSLKASTAARTLRFRSRSRIPFLPLAEVLDRISHQTVPHVTLPGPTTKLGDVGDQTHYYTLASLVQAIRPSNILEFGTYLGVSAYAMTLNAPEHCTLYTVDLPDNATASGIPELNQIDKGHIATSRQRVGEAFLGTPMEKRIRQLRADSMSFNAKDHLDQADLVFVDGGHSRPVVAKDTENAFRVLTPNGTILWDDYFHLYPDVVEFLDELSSRYTLHAIQGTNLVLYNPSWRNS